MPTTCKTYPLRSGCSTRGADMGRISILPEDLAAPIRLSLVRLRWVDGDYDPGGAYWGRRPGEWIYRAVGDDAAGVVEIFARAQSRAEAKGKIRALVPGARFYR